MKPNTTWTWNSNIWIHQASLCKLLVEITCCCESTGLCHQCFSKSCGKACSTTSDCYNTVSYPSTEDSNCVCCTEIQNPNALTQNPNQYSKSRNLPNGCKFCNGMNRQQMDFLHLIYIQQYTWRYQYPVFHLNWKILCQLDDESRSLDAYQQPQLEKSHTCEEVTESSFDQPQDQSQCWWGEF